MKIKRTVFIPYHEAITIDSLRVALGADNMYCVRLEIKKPATNQGFEVSLTE